MNLSPLGEGDAFPFPLESGNPVAPQQEGLVVTGRLLAVILNPVTFIPLL